MKVSRISWYPKGLPRLSKKTVLILVQSATSEKFPPGPHTRLSLTTQCMSMDTCQYYRLSGKGIRDRPINLEPILTNTDSNQYETFDLTNADTDSVE